jgi:aspartate/glutamate racemase
MIDVTTQRVRQNIEESGSSTRTCGILAGSGCISAGIFQESLSSRGIEAVIPCETSQELLFSVIYRIKTGDKGD